MMKTTATMVFLMSALVIAGCGGGQSDRAEAIQDALDESFSCDWVKEEEDTPLYRCDEENLILFTGDDDAIEGFVDNIEDSGIGGSAVMGDGYVILTETKTPAEEAKTALGDEAEVVEIGPYGGSGGDLGEDPGGFSWND